MLFTKLIKKHKKVLAKQAEAIYLEHLSAKLIKDDFKSQFRSFIIALMVGLGLFFSLHHI
jgi:hypothetical protein